MEDKIFLCKNWGTKKKILWEHLYWLYLSWCQLFQSSCISQLKDFQAECFYKLSSCTFLFVWVGFEFKGERSSVCLSLFVDINRQAILDAICFTAVVNIPYLGSLERKGMQIFTDPHIKLYSCPKQPH